MTGKRRTRMNKTLISIEELKQIALREIHTYTYPGSEVVSAVGIYPATDEVVESNRHEYNLMTG